MHDLLQRLLELELPVADHALFGSGPMLARGWIDTASDLDVIARGSAWDAALKAGELRTIEEYGIELVVVDDYITVGTTWGIGDFSVDSLIDTAQPIAGIPCVLLEHVVAYKKIANRPKDREHLAIIRSKLESEVGT